jgi:hypothetical protein
MSHVSLSASIAATECKRCSTNAPTMRETSWEAWSRSPRVADAGAASGAIACFDTTRTYAQGKLDRADERAATARRMRPTCCHVLDHENDVADGAHAMLEHLGNIRAALAWSFSGAGDRASAWHLPRRRSHYSSHCRSLASAHRWAELALGAFSDADRGTRLEMDLQAAVGVALMFTRTPVNDRWAISCTSSPMAPTISGKDN